jgi:hypothetical protein
MMKKSYQLLYIAFFAIFFIINISNLFEPDFSIALVVMIVLVSLMESLIPYLIIILIIRIINKDSRSP